GAQAPPLSAVVPSLPQLWPPEAPTAEDWGLPSIAAGPAPVAAAPLRHHPSVLPLHQTSDTPDAADSAGHGLRYCPLRDWCVPTQALECPCRVMPQARKH